MTDYRCRVCDAQYVTDRPRGREPQAHFCPKCLPFHHWCYRCKRARLRSEFRVWPARPNGLDTCCIPCREFMALKLIDCVGCNGTFVTDARRTVHGRVKVHNKRSKYLCDACITQFSYCVSCFTVKPRSDFDNGRLNRKGVRYHCKQCRRAERAQLPRLRAKRVQQYGLTVEDYDRMWNEQDGKCAICRRPQQRYADGRLIELSVDHCHKTGRVRGLLCSGCNRALGYMDDNPDWLSAASDYLRAA
ncbi:endonuclease VII domain-containing protein [Nocardia brasiliensis]|uniref:endonuclease VII domain-containing protein n=1 Tax=Nocardia brasiliensis TaxID=37326 RepID=UPI003D7968AE